MDETGKIVKSAINGSLDGATRVVMSDGRSVSQMTAEEYLQWLILKKGLDENGEVSIQRTCIQQLDNGWIF